MSKPVTIRKLALAANVSIGTVSRALKGQSGLSEQTRGEILKLAAEMGYDLGKLRSTRPRRILFVYNRELSSLATNPYYSHVLHGAETACREASVDLSVLSVAPGEAVAP
jgi:DNA-binding LacI/PurR family transcriptional regulator